jgi:hypothetical protein
MDDLKYNSLKVFKALFEGKEEVKVNGQSYPIKTYSPSGVKHVDISNYRYLEQNPTKNSHWAEKARKGHKIMWILKDWEYIGLVHNGTFKDFR